MAENLTPKKRVNRDKPDFATKQRMFGLLAIDGGPLLSMTAGPAVPQLLPVWILTTLRNYSYQVQLQCIVQPYPRKCIFEVIIG